MGRKLRVFISSTMKDLANERLAVADLLTRFNFEPVNAESWSPTGTKSWARIEQEIESSNIFVLIIGERYGWIPERGPMAGSGLSVTQLEYNKARDLGLPVLPFLKRLDYDANRSSEDSRKRDAFRESVKDWQDGILVREFQLAPDLATAVGEAVIALLSDEFGKTRITERSELASESYLVLAAGTARPGLAPAPIIPATLVRAVARRQAVLFAGSGISLAAGLPSASAFAQRLIQLVREHDPEYEVNPVGSAFAGIASDLEAARERRSLVEAVLNLIHPPQGIGPTMAHRLAVKLFERVVTTNYDNLFEEALMVQGLASPVVSGEIQDATLPPRVVVKLHGSAHDPDTLLLTERDIAGFDHARKNLWRATVDIFRSCPVVVVGSSLRDPSILRLFTETGPQLSGFFVAPYLWDWTPKRLQPWNLECIATDADTFMQELARLVETASG